jgi:hypothetical protein
MDLGEWIDGRTGLVSIDADFFTQPEEFGIVEDVAAWFAGVVLTGARVTFHEDHVDLVDLMTDRVDVAVNFDFHMDLRREFLMGAKPLVPPQDATVFESILASGLADRYVWAHPVSRRKEVAWTYAAAVVAGRQALLKQIHCIPGVEVLQRLLNRMTVGMVFVCRSPGYATANTDLAFRHLRATAEHVLAN